MIRNSNIYTLFIPLAIFVFLTGQSIHSLAANANRVLHQAYAKDGSVLASWYGEDPRELTGRQHMPISYGFQRLVFTFTHDGKKIEFKPSGELFFNSWSFDIFSGNRKHVVLLQDHYGPYHVVELKGLRSYLIGQSPPLEIVQGNLKEDEIALVHSPLHWITENTFSFSVACCGKKRLITHEIGSDTSRGEWTPIHK